MRGAIPGAIVSLLARMTTGASAPPSLGVGTVDWRDVNAGEKPDQRAEQNTATAGGGGEVVRGGRDSARGAGRRKLRSGYAVPAFPAEDGVVISPQRPFSARGWPWRPWGIPVCSEPLRRISASLRPCGRSGRRPLPLGADDGAVPRLRHAVTAPTVAARAQRYQSSSLTPSRSRTPSSTPRLLP